MGVCYDSGAGVAKDKQEAARWFRKAAEKGVAEAQYNLGVMSLKGDGAPQDYTAAYMWFNLAAAGGHEGAADVRDKILRGLPADQVAEGQRRATAFASRLESPEPENGAARGAPWAGGTQEAAAAVATGTGFFISTDGYLLTAAHVLADARRVQVRTGQGVTPAKVVRVDTGNDVALLKVEGRYPALPIAPSKSVKPGAAVFTVGFPNVGVQGFAPKLTKGDVNSISGIQDDPRAFQISVAVQPGNSGGPLIDHAGNVVGLVVARLDDAKTLGLTGSLPQNVNYALKSSYILPMLEPISDLAEKLPEPHASQERPFDAVAREAEAAVCLVLVY
jgi:S1-C subfamily serine protease